ncbi:MAG: FkbM family methyltransferase [Clostridiales bacterium]|nr:FkbM family methyltransferase [Clostridiales bacterium]
MQNFEVIKSIYSCLQDDISRKIFSLRLLLSLTNDINYIEGVVATTDVGLEFIEKINNIKSTGSPIVIYGAGSVGNRLMNSYPNLFTAFIDKRFKELNLELPVYDPEWLKSHKDCYIVLAFGRGKYREEVLSFLHTIGMPEENTIDIYNINSVLWGRQYFDLPELNFKQNEVFVDCGSFNGATISAFKLWNKEPFECIAFEPEKTMAEIIRNKVPYAKVINAGVWDENGILRFRTSGSSLMQIADSNGDNELQVVRLDDELKDRRVTFIKMDIEGSEMNALKGAEEIIRKQKPKLAICIYHKLEDIWEIPQIILNYRPDYRLYLRHYSIHLNETVLYAL